MAQRQFDHLPVYPIQPLLLARDASAEAGLQDLIRCGAQIGYTVQAPKRSEIALRGKAVLGLGLSEGNRLKAALLGTYAKEVWSDAREALSAVWPASLLALLYQPGVQADADAEAVKMEVFGLLAGAKDVPEAAKRALRFLWRAWNLHHQVILKGRPMSLWPSVGGEILSDVTTFTPVLTCRVEDWQIGWDGDARQDSPMLLKVRDAGAALEAAWSVFSRWYGEETETAGARLRAAARKEVLSPPHLYHGAYEHALAANDRLGQGAAVLEGISHGRLFSLHTARRGTLLFRADRRTAAAVLQLACRQYGQTLPPPQAAEVVGAYLALWAGKELAFAEAGDVDPGPVQMDGDRVRTYTAAADERGVSVGIFEGGATIGGRSVVGKVMTEDRRAFLVGGGRGRIALHALGRRGLMPKALAMVDTSGVDLRDPPWKAALAAWAVYASKGV